MESCSLCSRMSSHSLLVPSNFSPSATLPMSWRGLIISPSFYSATLMHILSLDDVEQDKDESRTSRTDFFHLCGDLLRYFRCASPIAYCVKGINISLPLIVSLTPDLGHVSFEYEDIECPLPIWVNFQESFDGRLPLSISRTLLHFAILSSNMFRLFEGLSFLLFTHATHANPAFLPPS